MTGRFFYSLSVILLLCLAKGYGNAQTEPPQVCPAFEASKPTIQAALTPVPRHHTPSKRHVTILPVEGIADEKLARQAEEILSRSLVGSSQFEVRSAGSGAADYLVRTSVIGRRPYMSAAEKAATGALMGLSGGIFGLLLSPLLIVGGAASGDSPELIVARVELLHGKSSRPGICVAVSGEGMPKTGTTPTEAAMEAALDKAVEWLGIHIPFPISGVGSFAEFVSTENIFDKEGGTTVITSARQTERARVLEISDSLVKVALKNGEEGWVYKESLRPSEPDETFPPTIKLTSPVDGREVFNARIEVSGRIWATRRISSITVNDRVADIKEGIFSIQSYPLSLGENILTIRATDEAANSVMKAVRLTRLKNALDNVSPEVKLSSPTDNVIVMSQIIEVAGEVKDNIGVAWVKVNGREVDLLRGVFRIANFPLAPGKNTVNITAEDDAGNIAEKTLTVIRQLDTTPPVIKIITPLGNAVVRAEGVTIAGNISDDSGLALVTINGKPVKVTEGKFTLESYNLRVGSNSIIVKATDRAGNEATETVIVERVVGGSPGARGLSLENIEDLLKGGVSTKRVASLIEERGIKFEVSDETKAALVRAGADRTVIRSIEKLLYPGK